MKSKGLWSRLIVTAAFFLAAAATACVLFLYADMLRTRAADIDRAVMAAQETAESFKAGREVSGIVYFDEKFNQVHQKDEGGFALTVEVIDNGDGIYRLSLAIERLKPYRFTQKTEVYNLTTSVYRRGG